MVYNSWNRKLKTWFDYWMPGHQKHPTTIYLECVNPTDVDITERAIQVGGVREGQSFVLKV
jgi:hypothetical protein